MRRECVDRTNGPIAIIQSAIARDPSLSVGARHLYTVLATYANYETDKSRECWPGRKRIQVEMGISEPTLIRHKNELIEAGLLIVAPRERENGSQSSNLYTLREYKDGGTLNPPTTKETLGDPHSQNISPQNIPEEEHTKDNNLRSRRAALAAAADNTPQPKSKLSRQSKTKAPVPSSRTAGIGWEVETLPASLKNKPVGAWNCNDMIRYHGHKWKLFFAKHPKQETIPQHRSNMKQWVNTSGGQKVKDTVKFAFENWKALQYRHKSLSSAVPDLHVLMQYRASFEEDCTTNVLTKTADAEFDKSQDRTQGNEVGW